MPFARPDLWRIAAAALLSAAPVAAAKRAPPVPAIELPAAAPLIDVIIAGQTLRLTVDFGADDIVQINPDSPARALLAKPARPDGKPVRRGMYRVAVGQTNAAIPFTRETLLIAGRAVAAQVLAPDTAPPGQTAGSDGTIGLPLLPHDGIRIVLRPANARDRSTRVPARVGRSDAIGFDWQLGAAGSLDVELHPLRPASVASAAAASDLAEVGGGRLAGAVKRIPIDFGVSRPTRRLVLARPVSIAGLAVTTMDVRLYDWAGRSELPEDAESDDIATVVARRGRQRGWPLLKIGEDVLAACASIAWQKQPPQLELVCPAR